MKMKTAFILFNIIFVFIVSMLFGLPFLVLDIDLACMFWQTRYPLLLVLVLVWVAIDLYFITSWRYLTILEREDWPALSIYLEKEIFSKRRWSRRRLQLLAGSYLVLTDIEALRLLETRLARQKPRLFKDNILIFGIGRLLAQDISGARAFFVENKVEGREKQKDWLFWYRAFTSRLDGDIEAARELYFLSAERAKDYLVLALTLLELNLILPTLDIETMDRSESKILAIRNKIRGRFPEEFKWQRYMNQRSSEIHIVVIAHMLSKTVEAIYAEY